MKKNRCSRGRKADVSIFHLYLTKDKDLTAVLLSTLHQHFSKKSKILRTLIDSIYFWEFSKMSRNKKMVESYVETNILSAALFLINIFLLWQIIWRKKLFFCLKCVFEAVKCVLKGIYMKLTSLWNTIYKQDNDDSGGTNLIIKFFANCKSRIFILSKLICFTKTKILKDILPQERCIDSCIFILSRIQSIKQRSTQQILLTVRRNEIKQIMVISSAHLWKKSFTSKRS